MPKTTRPNRYAHLQPINGGAEVPLQPPPELNKAERETFAVIAATVKLGHFNPCDARLLGLYVQALTLARKTGAEVDKKLGNASPALLKAYSEATRRVCSLATKLRLTPLSRSPQKSARTNDAPRLTSYYDRVAGDDA
jgi:phage terminase small subunit